jgi:nucleotide-binding universal stress UspA family protein
VHRFILMEAPRPSVQARRRVIWAVDPFEEDASFLTNAARSLEWYVTPINAWVEPVYVFMPEQFEVETGSSPFAHTHFKDAAERALASRLKPYLSRFSPRVEHPRVLALEDGAPGNLADRLIEHAMRAGAELIAVNTHGRQGIARLLLGSFAETLLLRSPIPVMVVSRHLNAGVPENLVLFPTDFGPGSRDAFRAAVRIARDRGARMIVHHAIPHPIEPVLQSGLYLLGGAWIPVQPFSTDESERQRRRAEAWARCATRSGVPARALVETGGVSVADRICAVANRERAGLIAMEAHSGRMSAALLGSVTRQVSRQACAALWVSRGPLAHAVAA